MASVLLFGPARLAAGCGRVEIEAQSLGELCDAACTRFGETFAGVLETSSLWVNGEPAEREQEIGEHDEVAVVPPVSGGM